MTGLRARTPCSVAPAWPRRAAGHRSDITENALREIFLPLGVVDVKVATLGRTGRA